MRLRDAIKSADRCEREGIGDPTDGKYELAEFVFSDGGTGEQVTEFVRENRRRLNRVEDRLALSLRIQFLLLGLVMSLFVAALVFIGNMLL